MTEDQSQQKIEEKKYSQMFRWSIVLSILAGLIILYMVWMYFFFYPDRIGPEQPIPFSHRIHVTEKRISCVFCHSEAINTDVAGIPPLETCMLCHSKIIIHYPHIVNLRNHYYNKIPIEWARVNILQEFAYFSHQTHIQSGVDCGKCHGNVAQMDRIIMKEPFNMGFCIQCHRDTKVSYDCWMCHR